MFPAKTGWRPIRVTDLRATGQEPGACDRCPRRNLRFLHVLAHPTAGERAVGSECARRLCFGYPAAREEAKLRSRWARRSRWLTRNWGTSWNGNPTLRFKHGGRWVQVTVFFKFGRWSFSVAVGREPPDYPRGGYPTPDAAKLGAFD